MAACGMFLRFLLVLADDPLGRPRTWRGLCAELRSALPRPTGLRDPVWRHGQTSGLSGEPSVSRLNHLGGFFWLTVPH